MLVRSNLSGDGDTPRQDLQSLTQRLANVEAALLSLPANGSVPSQQSIEVIRLNSRIDKLEEQVETSMMALKVQVEEQFSALRMGMSDMASMVFANLHLCEHPQRDVHHEPPEQPVLAERSIIRDCDALSEIATSSRDRGELCRSLSFQDNSPDIVTHVACAESHLSRNVERLQRELSEDLSEKFEEARILMKATWESTMVRVLERVQEHTRYELDVPPEREIS
jgi:hypothetical protein